MVALKSFDDLTQEEILALAISSEEEDGRVYADFAEGLRDDHPDTAQVFSDMADEENDHRRMLIDLYASKFGRHIPLLRRTTAGQANGAGRWPVLSTRGLPRHGRRYPQVTWRSFGRGIETRAPGGRNRSQAPAR